MPDDLIKTRPHLCLYQAWALLVTRQSQAAEKQLQEIEQRVTDNSAETAAVLGTTAAIRATAARLRGNLPQTISLSQQALAQLPEHEYFWRASTALNLGTIYFLSDDLVAAEKGG